MRESHKSDLKNILTENVHDFETYPTSQIVANAGVPLHQVSWNKNVLIVRSLISIVITYKIITVHVLQSLMAVEMELVLKIMNIDGEIKEWHFLTLKLNWI